MKKFKFLTAAMTLMILCQTLGYIAPGAKAASDPAIQATSAVLVEAKNGCGVI